MRSLSYLSGIAVLCSLSFNVAADPVTIEFTATVTSVQNPSAVNEVNIGDGITGSFTFDTDLPDANSDPNIADYRMPGPLPASMGFTLNIGSLSFTPDTASPSSEAYAHVSNGIDIDQVNFDQCCSAGHLSNGVQVTDIKLMFHHPENLFDTAVLSETIPYLDSMADRDIRIAGYGNGQYYEIWATVNTLNPPETSCLVPAQNSVRFNAQVSHIYDSTNGLAGMVSLGDSIAGEYRFNPDVPNTGPDPYLAVYAHEAGEPSSGFIIDIADTTLSSKNTASWFDVVVNDGPTDKYGVYTGNAAMELPNGSIITDVRFELEDHSGTAIDGVSLLDISPASLTIWARYDLYIDGHHADGSYFSIIAELSSVIEGPFVSGHTEPEPALAISPGGGKFISEQQFDTLLVFDNSGAGISGINVRVVNGPASQSLNCVIGPILEGGTKHSIICSSAANPLLGPGTNTLEAEVGLSDGTILSNTVDWEMLAY